MLEHCIRMAGSTAYACESTPKLKRNATISRWHTAWRMVCVWMFLLSPLMVGANTSLAIDIEWGVSIGGKDRICKRRIVA